MRRQTQRDRAGCGVRAPGGQRVGFQVHRLLREVLQSTRSMRWLCCLGMWLGQELFLMTPRYRAALLGWQCHRCHAHYLHGSCRAAWGVCTAGVSPSQAGQEHLLPGSRSTRTDPDQRQQQAPTPPDVPRTPTRKHLGDATTKSLAGRRALGRAPTAGTCRENVPITLPSIPAQPRPARQRAHAHRLWVPRPSTAWWGSPLQWVAWVGWGAAYLLPRGVGSVSPGTGPQAPRVSV